MEVLLCSRLERSWHFFFIIIISESLDLNDDDKMPLEPFPGCRSQKRKNEKEMEISDLKEQYSNLNL